MELAQALSVRSLRISFSMLGKRSLLQPSAAAREISVTGEMESSSPGKAGSSRESGVY